MLEVTAEIIQQKLETKSKQQILLEELFSFRNRSRIRRVVFEAFTKWKLQLKYNYPMYSKKQERVYGLISLKTLEKNKHQF